MQNSCIYVFTPVQRMLCKHNEKGAVEVSLKFKAIKSCIRPVYEAGEGIRRMLSTVLISLY